MGHVFISYSREEDQPYARRLADDLRTHDIEVWIDDDVDYGARCRAGGDIIGSGGQWGRSMVNLSNLGKKAIKIVPVNFRFQKT